MTENLKHKIDNFLGKNTNVVEKSSAIDGESKEV